MMCGTDPNFFPELLHILKCWLRIRAFTASKVIIATQFN